MGLKLSDDEVKRILNVLSDKTGIVFEERKMAEVYKHKLEDFIASLPYRDFNKLILDITTGRNKKLLEELVNRITVNETYFFRESYQFEVLVDYCIPEIVKSKSGSEPIRILSAPCSTGEEVYSIMIYLLEEGSYINRYDFMILGVDIDVKAIERAKKGIYSERSVHKLSRDLLEKYFQKVGKGQYQVKRFLREGANFLVVNILDKEKMLELGKFDVIFSRNMLIYFDAQNKAKAIDIFYELLNPGGFLFLGHAETLNAPDKFELVKYDNNFIYRRR